MDRSGESDRIASMERTVRSLRMIVLTLAATQILWVLLGAAWQEDRNVRRLTIVDAAGKPRIEMKTDDAGNPSISLMDKEGHSNIDVKIDDMGSELYLRGSPERGVATLQASPDGTAWLMLDGGGPKLEGSNIRMTATGGRGDHQQQYSEIIVENPAVESSVRLTSHSHGSEVGIVKDGIEPVALHIDDDGASGLTISDARDDKPFERIKLLLDPNGQPKFEVRDREGKDVKP